MWHIYHIRVVGRDSSMQSKFEALSTNQLILGIQSLAMTMEALKRDKKASTKSVVRKAAELMEMRGVVVERLKKLDRSYADFFPIGSWCTFRHPSHPQQVGVCQVTGYEDNTCLVLIQRGDSDLFTQGKVEPRFLTLMYIRHKY